MSSLLDSLKEQITPDVIRGLTSSLGESGDAVQKRLLGGATIILATLASKAQEPGFLSQIMNLISSFTTRGASASGVFRHTLLVGWKHPGLGCADGARHPRIESERPRTYSKRARQFVDLRTSEPA